MIGFDTPSKKLSEQTDKQKNDNFGKSIETGAGIESPNVKAEAIERTEALGSLIISEAYNAYTPEQKIHILQEFAFLSKVASCL
jgi:hypothetical protein